MSLSTSTPQPLGCLPVSAAQPRRLDLPLEVLRQILRALPAAAGGARDKKIVGELSRWRANISLLRAKGGAHCPSRRLDVRREKEGANFRADSDSTPQGVSQQGSTALRIFLCRSMRIKHRSPER
jgi:hypothetical protein